MPLLIALQFLTRLPVRLPWLPSPEENGRSLLWYPAVGLLLGLLLTVLHGLLAGVASGLQAALLLCVWVWLSGGLHLDGLADTADAWVGGYGDRERTLAIMKDPACGPIGVITLVLLLLVKWAALVALLQAGHGYMLLLAPWFARWSLPLALLSMPYVRPGGLGQVLAEHAPRQRLLIFLIVHTLAMLFWGWAALLGLLLTLGVLLLVRRQLLRRLGGTTGDTAGAIVELTEAVVLMGVAVLLI